VTTRNAFGLPGSLSSGNVDIRAVKPTLTALSRLCADGIVTARTRIALDPAAAFRCADTGRIFRAWAMTQRLPADRRSAMRSPVAWLAALMAAILLAGFGAWLFYGQLPVAAPPPPAVAVAPPPAPVAPAGPRVIEARLSQVLAGRHTGMAIYRPVENPRVLIIDFPSLAEQARAMNRLAALIEKHGAPRDRLLSDAEIAAMTDNAATFYFAHDYAATSLARFFSMAEAEGETLNAHEKDLLALLLAADVIHRDGAGYVPGQPEKAVISLVQPQADDPATPEDETVDAALRDTMLRHEMSHGEFFTNEAYRRHCERFWREKLTEAERTLFRAYLSRHGYDPQDETLMINEAQAYLMHTPDRRAFSADALKVTAEQLVDMQRRFMDPQPPTPLLGAALPTGG